MAETLKLEIVTPEAVAYSEEVNRVTLPAVEGDMGVYPRHVPLMTEIASGELVVQRNGVESYIAVGEGFVEITATKVAILTDMAVNADDIDEAKAEEARKRAEARLQEKLSDEEIASVKASLTHSLAQLRVKRQRRAK